MAAKLNISINISEFIANIILIDNQKFLGDKNKQKTQERNHRNRKMAYQNL